MGAAGTAEPGVVTGSTALSLRLKQRVPIPLNVECSVPAGAVTAIFGPSGSGKTTILRTIAGLYVPEEAEIVCGDTCWTSTRQRIAVPAHRRRIGMVFQDYALFPHLTVREQIGMAMPHVARSRRRCRTDALVDLVELAGFADRKPAALSGGQQQRVAIARALARDPQVLLLDEPFASVDWALRESMRRELLRLQTALGLAVVLVTHDFSDVAKLASHLVLLDRGAVTAAGSVQELTALNALPGIAAVREPGVLLDANVLSHDAARELSELAAGDLRLCVPRVAPAVGARVRVQIPARDVILAVRRPEGLSLHNVLDAEVLQIDEAPQSLRLVHLSVGGTRLLALVTRDAVRSLGLAPGVAVMALIKSVGVESFG